MSITLKQVEQRVYAMGNTWAIKDGLKKIGAHFDPIYNAWWVGSVKRGDLQSLIAAVQSPSDDLRSDTEITEATRLLGKVSYRGRSYFLLYTSKDGAAHKVCSLDGQMVFWAKVENGAKIEKKYGRNGSDYPTVGSMRAFVNGLRVNENQSQQGSQPNKSV
jgi:hypothetical protein